jgi:thioesterase domain-containing protein
LDEQLNPVPIGVTGQIHIGGVGLARGYLNQPELTAQMFIADPFSAKPGARLYKTGDLARYLHDGNIEYVGRIDQQVKLRGYRIELGEIEAVLSRHPSVQSCAVLCREDRAGDKRLVAYVVPSAGRALDAQQLREHLAQKLPQYMLPAVFVQLEAMPLTPSGKLDRSALPAPTPNRGDAPLVAPRNPLEGALAGIFSSVLNVERVGMNEDFFALGGSSLSAVQVVSRAQQLGIAISLQQMFAGASIAKLVSSLTAASSMSSLVELRAGQSPGALVLVPPSGGMFHRVRELVSALAVQTSIYGLLSPCLVGVQELPSTLAELAARYGQEIMELIPEGPIVLIGYSFGGHVALELGQQLLQKGRTVERIVVLDAAPPDCSLPAAFDACEALKMILDTFGASRERIAGLDYPAALAEVASTVASARSELAHISLFLEGIVDSVRLTHALLPSWEPRIPAVDVHLLRTAAATDRAPDYGWQRYGTLASVQIIPGEHHTILGAPYLETTAQAICQLLAQEPGSRGTCPDIDPSCLTKRGEPENRGKKTYHPKARRGEGEGIHASFATAPEPEMGVC